MATYQKPAHDMGNHVRLPLTLEPQPEGGFTITSPLVPELITEADTLADVMPNVLDAWATVVELYQDFGRSLPAELYVMDVSAGPVTIDAIVPA